MAELGPAGALTSPVHRPSAGWLLAVFALLLALQIALYSESFSVGPSGDDLNAPLADIWRAEREGPMALIQRSAQPHNYRPLQSLTMWAFGAGSPEHRLLRLHILSFVGMAVFAAAAWLWLRALPSTRLARFCGALAIFVHPALVAPLAGIDGFATLFSTGLMWISVYVTWAWRDRLAVGLPLALLIFLLALGFKEYALAAVPLACAAMLCFSRTPKQATTRAFIVGLAYALVVLAWFMLRRITIPPPASGQHIGYFVIDPVQWAKNAMMFAGALLFPGSTKWLFLNRIAPVLAVGGAAMLACGAAILAGLWCRWRDNGKHTADQSELNIRRWIALSLLGVIGASFPAVLVSHVSEMYVAGMILPLGLLIALAADGVRSCGSAWRIAFAIIFIGATIWAAGAVRAKVSDLRRIGDRTATMLQQVLAFIPEDARDIKVALCFPPESQTTPAYSVFENRAPLLVEQPQALWWLRPHRGLELAFPQPTLEEALDHADDYAVILQWNHAEQRMQLVRSNLPAAR